MFLDRPQKDLRITVLEPNRRIEVEGTLAQFSAHLTYRLASSQTGTESTNTVVLQPEGAPRLAGPLIANRISQSVADNLSQLTLLTTSEDIKLAIDISSEEECRGRSGEFKGLCRGVDIH